MLSFQKQHDFVLCVDSDGCVIDGMTIKHLECFGPALLEIFDFMGDAHEILEHWNKINLYASTRGINRFKGLLLLLQHAVAKGWLVLDLTALTQWADTASELSNQSLQQQILLCKQQANGSEVPQHGQALQLALDWSLCVNQKVNAMPEEKKLVFPAAKDALHQVKDVVDVVVVSSANAAAVQEEWAYNQMLDLPDLVLTQEHGSKKDCLCQLLALGYTPNQIIMLGDSPGDIIAAKESGVLYYPIPPSQENEAWQVFCERYFPMFLQGHYQEKQMQACEASYYDTLAK
ncbi:MAG: HAD hydrolase-like protein [Faecalibacterium sp.]